MVRPRDSKGPLHICLPLSPSPALGLGGPDPMKQPVTNWKPCLLSIPFRMVTPAVENLIGLAEGSAEPENAAEERREGLAPAGPEVNL